MFLKINKNLFSNLKYSKKLNNFKFYSNAVDNSKQNEIVDEDMPIDMKNPFIEEKPCCVLCKYNIEVNYKNTRLLSQFVSTYTGLLYDRNVVGLCEKQYDAVKYHLKQAQYLNFMPRFFKKPEFRNDPKLYNPFDPIKQNNV